MAERETWRLYMETQKVRQAAEHKAAALTQELEKAKARLRNLDSNDLHWAMQEYRTLELEVRRIRTYYAFLKHHRDEKIGLTADDLLYFELEPEGA